MVDRAIEGITRYAAGDKSDPFTLARCMTHLRMGLCAFQKDGSDGGYNADPYQEPRVTPLGAHYTVTCYKNMARP